MKFNPFTGTLDFSGSGSGGTPGGSNTQLQFNNSGAFGGTDAFWNATDKSIIIPHLALATTSTDGLLLRNTTAAANNAQQISPRLHFLGHGWKSVGSVDQVHDWIAELSPWQDNATGITTNRLDFDFQIAGAGYLHGLSLVGFTNGDINVGFGTQEPRSTAHFVASQNPELRFVSLLHSNEARFTVDDSNSLVKLISAGGGGSPYDIALALGGSVRLRVSTTGVLIGDNYAPSAPFQMTVPGGGGVVYLQGDQPGFSSLNGAGICAGADVAGLSGDTILAAVSTTKGFLPSQMTTAQRDLIGASSPGLMIANSDTGIWDLFDGVRGLFVMVGGLPQPRKLTVISDYTFVSNTDDVALIDTSSNNVTVSLPATGHGGGAVPDGKQFIVKWIAGGNIATLTGNGSNIDMGSSITLASLNDSITVMWDELSATWYII